MAGDLFLYAFRMAAPSLCFELVASLDDVRTTDPSVLFYSFINRGCDQAAIEKALARLCERFPNHPLVIVTDTAGEELGDLMTTYGVARWLSNAAGFNALVAAVQEAAAPCEPPNGDDDRPATLVEHVSAEERQTSLGLTVKETHIVRLLHEGKSNKLIAHTLSCSESTVKVHIANMMRKLRLHNRTQLALVYQSVTNQRSEAIPVISAIAARKLEPAVEARDLA